MMRTTSVLRACFRMGMLLLLTLRGPSLLAQAPALDRERIDAWRQAPAYQYGMEPVPRTRTRGISGSGVPPLMQRLPLWAEVLIYGLMGSVLIVLAVVLIRRGWGRSSRPLHSPAQAAGSPEAEVVPLADYEQLTRQALGRGEYRMAIRYTYLAVLQRLDHLQMIEWEPQKTNADYQRELASSPASAPFQALTRIFEYCWYGEVQPGPDHFSRVSELAHAFHRELPPRP